MVGPAAKREAVAHLRNVLQMSERRACSVIAADRTSIRYQFCRPPDTELRCRLRNRGRILELVRSGVEALYEGEVCALGSLEAALLSGAKPQLNCSLR